MMIFFQNVRTFLNTEKVFAWLLIAALFLQSFYCVFGQPDMAASPALEKLQAAQEAYEAKENKKEFLNDILTDDFKVIFIVLIAVCFFFGLFGAGFVLLVICMVRKILGKSMIVREFEVTNISWGLGEIAKVIIVFYSMTLFTGLFFGLANQYLFAGQTENLFILLHTLMMDSIVLFFVLYLVVVRHKQSLQSLGLGGRSIFRDIFLGFASYCVVLPLFVLVVAGLSYVIKLIHYAPPPHPLVDIFVTEDRQNPMIIYLSIFLACTVGPFIEEVFFRGFCYTTLKKHIGMKGAMILTSAFFAVIHYSLFALLPIFLLGMVLVYLYEKRGSLIPSITLHIVHNSLFIGYFFMVKRIILDKV